MNKKYIIIGIIVLVLAFIVWKSYTKKKAEKVSVEQKTIPVKTEVKQVQTQTVIKPTPIQEQTKAQALVKKEVVIQPKKAVVQPKKIAQTAQMSKGQQLTRRQLVEV